MLQFLVDQALHHHKLSSSTGWPCCFELARQHLARDHTWPLVDTMRHSSTDSLSCPRREEYALVHQVSAATITLLSPVPSTGNKQAKYPKKTQFWDLTLGAGTGTFTRSGLLVESFILDFRYDDGCLWCRRGPRHDRMGYQGPGATQPRLIGGPVASSCGLC